MTSLLLRNRIYCEAIIASVGRLANSHCWDDNDFEMTMLEAFTTRL